MFKRILLATDGSPIVERMLTYAVHLARGEPATVIVLHVYEPPEHYAQLPGYNHLLKQYRTVAQAVVDDAMRALEVDGVQVQGELRTGDAAEAIIAASKAYDVDLILLGTRGRSNIAAMLGSVSNTVLRSVSCPALIVP
jgi:nucleotide-binding universal stress UspA family protein